MAEVLYAAAAWRQQRSAAGGVPALTATLGLLEQLRMLPRHPSEVDAASADFRLLPPQLQRLAPPVIVGAMEAAHAKFTSLKRAMPLNAGFVGGATELQALRSRGEALVRRAS